jgi:hypothetical protein
MQLQWRCALCSSPEADFDSCHLRVLVTLILTLTVILAPKSGPENNVAHLPYVQPQINARAVAFGIYFALPPASQFKARKGAPRSSEKINAASTKQLACHGAHDAVKQLCAKFGVRLASFWSRLVNL